MLFAAYVLAAVILLQPLAYGQRKQSQQAVLAMARRVQREILSLPEYGVFDSLTFTIREYHVTLRGVASRPQLAKTAEAAVRKLEGVEQVTNQIEVLSFSRFDDDLRAAVYQNVFGHPSLARYSSGRGAIGGSLARAAGGITNDPPIGFHAIHIVVKNGNVRLEGTVASEADRTVAFIQANSTPGAFAVENKIDVAKR